MGYIYKITNTISNKHYIGVTRKNDVEDRWKGHIRAINEGKGCPLLAKAIKKYGVDKFIFEVIIICFDEDVYLYEPLYIKKYSSLAPNGYNATPGGMSGTFIGKKHSEESKKKDSESLKKYYENNPEVRQKLSERFQLHKEKLILSIKEAAKKRREDKDYKKELSQEVKNKIRDSLILYNKNKKIDDKNKHIDKMKTIHGIKIAQYDLSNNLINIYDTIKDAEKATGIHRANISAANKKANNRSCGFIWKRI